MSAVNQLQNVLAVRTAQQGKVIAVANGVATISTNTGERLQVSVAWTAKPGDRVMLNNGQAIKIAADGWEVVEA